LLQALKHPRRGIPVRAPEIAEGGIVEARLFGEAGLGPALGFRESDHPFNDGAYRRSAHCRAYYSQFGANVKGLFALFCYRTGMRLAVAMSVPRKTQLCPNPSALQRAVYALLEGTSINALAKKSGLAENTIRKFVTTPGATMTHDTLKKLADGAGVPLQALVGLRGPQKATLVGKVGAGAVVQIFPGAVEQGIAEEIDIPIGMDLDGPVEALEIEGDSMRPFESGWKVFYRPGNARHPSELLGQLCVVRLKDGTMLLKKLHRGYEPGRYNLVSWNADPIEDVEIEAAIKVDGIRTY